MINDQQHWCQQEEHFHSSLEYYLMLIPFSVPVIWFFIFMAWLGLDSAELITSKLVAEEKSSILCSVAVHYHVGDADIVPSCDDRTRLSIIQSVVVSCQYPHVERVQVMLVLVGAHFLDSASAISSCIYPVLVFERRVGWSYAGKSKPTLSSDFLPQDDGLK
ncbi:Mg(2+)/citrate complex secondary transporter [Trichinella pseudospiralis]